MNSDDKLLWKKTRTVLGKRNYICLQLNENDMNNFI